MTKEQIIEALQVIEKEIEVGLEHKSIPSRAYVLVSIKKRISALIFKIGCWEHE